MCKQIDSFNEDKARADLNQWTRGNEFSLVMREYIINASLHLHTLFIAQNQTSDLDTESAIRKRDTHANVCVSTIKNLTGDLRTIPRMLQQEVSVSVYIECR